MPSKAKLKDAKAKAKAGALSALVVPEDAPAKVAATVPPEPTRADPKPSRARR